MIIRGNTLEYWKNNAEEDYLKVPISVLKYITILEEALEVEAIAFAEWMAKEYWLNSSGKYTQGQTHKELLEIFKRQRSETVA